MLRSFVVDTERNLLEKEDLLGTMCYADQLVDTIKSVPAEQAYTIGLYGTWGSGKSTIIRTAKEKLEKDENSRIKMVVYDAWKYSGDSFRRMFLLHLQTELQLNTTPVLERFYTAMTEEIKPNLEFRRRGAIYLGGIIVLTLVAIILASVLEPVDAKVWVSIIFSVLSLYAVVFGGNLFYELKVSQTKNVLFAPEQFEECFRQMMVKVLKKKSWYSRLWRSTREYIANEMIPEDLDKLVIVIDNLDRCESEIVYSMLTDIKTFLGAEKYDVVFVVPVDDGALKKHLFEKHKEDNDMLNAEEFLRKFFNVVIRIKPHCQDDLLHYVNELNRDQKLDFNSNTLSLVARVYADNPRRILQMLNNLTVEQSLYDEEFAKSKETLIAACIMMREQYPEMVVEILKNDTILYVESIYIDTSGVADNDSEREKTNSLLPQELDKNVQFKSFMRKVRYAFQSANAEDLHRIFTNTDNALSNLSDSILQALNSYDYNEIVNYISQNPARRSDVRIEIIRRINDEDIHDAEDAMILWAECVAKVHQAISLRNDELHDLNDALSRIYDFIPRSVVSVDAICMLAKDLNAIDGIELKRVLFQFVQDTKNKKYKPYHGYVKGVLNVFTDEEDSRNLCEFAENYMREDADISEFTFTDTQKQYLLTSTFVEKIIDGISGVNDERQQKLLVWSFGNLIGLSTNVYEKLFAKFTALMGARDGKAFNIFCGVIEYALPVLRAIQTTIDIEILKNFFSYVMDNRRTPTGQSRSIADEVDESKAQVLADFCLEMHRVSGRHLTVNPKLLTVQKKCEKYVKARLLLIQQQEITLIPFRKNIAAFDEIDEEWYQLIPVVFEKDKNGTRADETVMKQKLQILYDYCKDVKALDVLTRLTEDEEVCQLFVSLVNINDFDTLNALPETLLPRIVSLYTQDSAEQFKGNNAMLKIVLRQNAKNMEDVVTKTLMDRLINDMDVEGVVDIIMTHEKWHHVKNKRQLKAMLEGKLPEINDGEQNEDVELTELQLKIAAVVEKL